jgi:hypothetical protein
MKKEKIGKKKLFVLLSLIDGVSDWNHRLTEKVIEYFNSEKPIQVISKSWGWDYKNKSPEYLPIKS